MPTDFNETLLEMFGSEEPYNEGLLSFEYPLYHASDEELDLFLGKLVRRVARTATQVARPVARAAQPFTRTVASVARTAGRGLQTINKVIPTSVLTSTLQRTPIGMAVRAGVGAVSAAASGKNVFQGAMRSLATDPAMRFAVDTATGVARGQNILKAAKAAGQAGIADARESLRFAAMVAPFVPGIGTGVAAALSAANALASGERITDALIAAARNAVPGGAIAQTGFDMAVNLAKGKSLSEAALNAARSRLPGGPAAQAAFDAGLTLAKGKSIQDAIVAGGGRLLPRSPYTADALGFVRKVAAGQNIGRAALSTTGNMVLNRIEQRTGPVLRQAQARFQREIPEPDGSGHGRWYREGGHLVVELG